MEPEPSKDEKLKRDLRRIDKKIDKHREQKLQEHIKAERDWKANYQAALEAEHTLEMQIFKAQNLLAELRQEIANVRSTL
jgi:hypothetical protein